MEHETRYAPEADANTLGADRMAEIRRRVEESPIDMAVLEEKILSDIRNMRKNTEICKKDVYDLFKIVLTSFLPGTRPRKKFFDLCVLYIRQKKRLVHAPDYIIVIKHLFREVSETGAVPTKSIVALMHVLISVMARRREREPFKKSCGAEYKRLLASGSLLKAARRILAELEEDFINFKPLQDFDIFYRPEKAASIDLVREVLLGAERTPAVVETARMLTKLLIDILRHQQRKDYLLFNLYTVSAVHDLAEAFQMLVPLFYEIGIVLRKTPFYVDKDPEQESYRMFQTKSANPEKYAAYYSQAVYTKTIEFMARHLQLYCEKDYVFLLLKNALLTVASTKCAKLDKKVTEFVAELRRIEDAAMKARSPEAERRVRAHLGEILEEFLA